MINTKTKTFITASTLTTVAYIVGFIIVKAILSQNNIYNFVDLQIKYKHYIVVDKNESSNKKVYTFVLKNPITNTFQRVYVKDYLYTNIYFVGDTIK